MAALEDWAQLPQQRLLKGNLGKHSGFWSDALAPGNLITQRRNICP
jgi:hypothetical protein